MSLTLDVGCGSGINQQYEGIKHRGKINTDVLKPTKPIPNFILCDAHYLPFKTKSFTNSFFVDVIEHVESPLKCLHELKRVTKHKIIIGTPNAVYFKYMLRSYIKGDYATCFEHIATWGCPELANLFDRAGIKKYKIKGSEYRIKEKWLYRILRMFFPAKMRKRQLTAYLTVT